MGSFLTSVRMTCLMTEVKSYYSIETCSLCSTFFCTLILVSYYVFVFAFQILLVTHIITCNAKKCLSLWGFIVLIWSNYVGSFQKKKKLFIFLHCGLERKIMWIFVTVNLFPSLFQEQISSWRSCLRNTSVVFILIYSKHWHS